MSKPKKAVKSTDKQPENVATYHLLKKEIPFFYVLLTFMLGVGLSYAFLFKGGLDKQFAVSPDQAGNSADTYQSSRLKGYDYIRPLLFSEPITESSRYNNVKGDVNKLLNDLKKQGDFMDASVYLRDFKAGDWMEIGGDLMYHPSSLMKIPTLMTFLKMAEDKPGLLERKIVFELPKGINLPVQNFKSKTIEIGKSYTIKELLRYMVEYSDNNATFILNQNLNVDILKKVFTDLGLPEPKSFDNNFQMSAKGYSVFMKALINASYLTKENSEFALELMSECEFNQGLQNGLPPHTKIAHKFGEWGDGATGIRELHESGIIYIKDIPYLLTVMTRGTDMQKLANVIASVTNVVNSNIQASFSAAGNGNKTTSNP